MGTLAFAVEELMTEQFNDDDREYGLSSHSFGPRLRHHAMPPRQVQATWSQPDHESRRGVPSRAAERLAEEYTQTRDVTRALQDGMRLMALDVDFHQYQRFSTLTPVVSLMRTTAHLSRIA
ncbi:hypothetical protein [Streptomyces sp. NPDC058548]|uniref:hypothetical protein n=1 Tax=Streptomyces sp. NPDC058548 TaxID=3346545 RepID=UPI00365D8D12